jgi:hypothetical protein
MVKENIEVDNEKYLSKIVDFKFKKSNVKKLIIFDLDETLIHCPRDVDPDSFELEEPTVILKIKCPDG